MTRDPDTSRTDPGSPSGTINPGKPIPDTAVIIARAETGWIQDMKVAPAIPQTVRGSTGTLIRDTLPNMHPLPIKAGCGMNLKSRASH